MEASQTNTIWNEFSSKLKSWLRSRVARKEDTEDLLQEIFIKIHLGLPSLKNEGRLSHWVFSITRNTLNDYYRSKSKFIEDRNFDFSLIGEKPNQETDLDVHECLLPFIDHLPENYKAPMILSEIEGLKHKEVSEKLGISLTAAKSRIARGREKIKQKFITCCNFKEGEDGKLHGEHCHEPTGNSAHNC